MGSKRFLSLHDFVRHHSDMAVRCRRCGHERTMAKLSSTSIEAFAKRLRCSKCGARGAEWWASPLDRR